MRSNDEIRRQLGCDLIREHQRACESKSFVQASKPVQQDEKPCHGESAELLEGLVIGAVKPELLPKRSNVLYFSSLEEFDAWCDSEGGKL